MSTADSRTARNEAVAYAFRVVAVGTEFRASLTDVLDLSTEYRRPWLQRGCQVSITPTETVTDQEVLEQSRRAPYYRASLVRERDL